jgi:hypothetical protein
MGNLDPPNNRQTSFQEGVGQLTDLFLVVALFVARFSVLQRDPVINF